MSWFYAFFETFLLKLDKNNPTSILKRGFACISNESGIQIESVNQVKNDDIVYIRMNDGQITAKVIEGKNGFWKKY